MFPNQIKRSLIRRKYCAHYRFVPSAFFQVSIVPPSFSVFLLRFLLCFLGYVLMKLNQNCKTLLKDIIYRYEI